MVAGQVGQGDEALSLLQMVMEKSPAGLFVLETDKVLLANPAAALLLGLSGNPTGQKLSMDGPDGSLADYIARAAKGKSALTFQYHPGGNHQDHTLLLKVVSLSGNRVLAYVEEVTSSRRVATHQEQIIRHTFHELKTPLAVLSLGLSNLSTYYERLPDADRRATIDDLAEQVRELGTVVSDLFQQMRDGLSKTILDE